MDDFYFKNTNGVITLHSKALDSAGFKKHCFTTKKGGCSKGYLAQTNLSFSRECEENVKENFSRVSDAVGFSKKAYALTNQQHTDIVDIIENDKADCGFYISKTAVDGYVTNQKDICLCVFVADCVPIILADTKNRVAACVHSGWRGTAKKISQNALTLMSKNYGTKPGDVIAAIGPCISKCCYEVGRDVYDEFGVSEVFTPRGDKFMLDLVFANTAVLKDAGVKKIDACFECTYCKSDLYYSHRATDGKRGNMAAMIEL